MPNLPQTQATPAPNSRRTHAKPTRNPRRTHHKPTQTHHKPIPNPLETLRQTHPKPTPNPRQTHRTPQETHVKSTTKPPRTHPPFGQKSLYNTIKIQGPHTKHTRPHPPTPTRYILIHSKGGLANPLELFRRNRGGGVGSSSVLMGLATIYRK